MLCNFYNQILNEEKLPEAMRTAIATLIYKKGDTSDINNYRTISLTCTGYKILTTILKNRMLPF